MTLKIRIALCLNLKIKKNQRPRISLHTPSWSWGTLYSSLNSAKLSWKSEVMLAYIPELCWSDIPTVGLSVSSLDGNFDLCRKERRLCGFDFAGESDKFGISFEVFWSHHIRISAASKQSELVLSRRNVGPNRSAYL